MNILITLILISLAGPIIGSFLGIIRKPSNRFLFNMLAFAAGVMLAISFLELIPESLKLSSVEVCIAGVILGSVVMYLIDKIIPHIHPSLCSQEQGCNIHRTATFVFIGMFMHNFPEGMAVAAGLSSSTKLSIVIALAITLHHIPEGICTSAPYYYCTKKRLKSFLISASTALPTVAGLLIFYILSSLISQEIIGLLMGITAGFMIYISSDELIPSACSDKAQHGPIFSLIGGIILVLLLKMINI